MAQLGKGLLGRLIGTGVAIVLALGIGFAVKKFQEKDAEGDAPQVGDCLAVTGTVNADHTEHGCGDAEATYKVTADDGGCDTNETSYKISLGTDSDAGNVADLCLALNAAEGDCFNLGATGEEKVDCAATKGTSLKVASVGKAGDKCAGGSQPLENKKRDILICLAENA